MNHTQTTIAAVFLCIGCSAGAGAVAQEISADAGRSAADQATVLAQHEQRAQAGGAGITPQAAQARATAESASRDADEKRPAPAGQSEKSSAAAHGRSAPDAVPSSDSAAQVLGPYGC